jgi:hypothetical protein
MLQFQTFITQLLSMIGICSLKQYVKLLSKFFTHILNLFVKELAQFILNFTNVQYAPFFFATLHTSIL